ncbi:DNA repair protein RadC [Pacificimonas sp. WHA3]|uniref:DNA repair protein RadC n=2 Tax=Pacificimonas pallii TaxID=2827236 RepID=A0ABS6SC87_9SPHN|nr:DNA repair protein RadC [Pacificimonas pallii]
MLTGGGDGFHDYELLEYVLALAKPRQDTRTLAKLLIDRFQTFGGVVSADPDDLKLVDGVGDSVVATLKFLQTASVRLLKGRIAKRPVLGNWQAVEDYLHAQMAHNPREEFRVLALDGRNVLIRDQKMTEGTVNETSVHVREVIKLALDLGATSIILVHNHPSGDSKPSRDDIALTGQISDICRALGIGLHDHIIVAKGGSSSFKTLGLL